MPTLNDNELSSQTVDNRSFNPATNAVAGDLATRIAGEDLVNDVQKVEQRFQQINLSAAATTVIKTGAGVLHAIVVNLTAAGTITLYDNTAGSGTKIATFKASIGENSYAFDCAFSTGLTAVLAAASDVTVVYR